jgi:hypothetical protein
MIRTEVSILVSHLIFLWGFLRTRYSEGIICDKLIFLASLLFINLVFLKEQKRAISTLWVTYILVTLSSISGVSERSSLSLWPLRRSLSHWVVVIVGWFSKDRSIFRVFANLRLNVEAYSFLRLSLLNKLLDTLLPRGFIKSFLLSEIFRRLAELCLLELRGLLYDFLHFF